MLKFTVICPECGNAVITQFPPSLLWERCPSCRNHIWDEYDALMAEAYQGSRSRTEAAHQKTEN